MGLHKNSPILTLYPYSDHCLEKDSGFTENSQLRKKFTVLLQAAKCISRRRPEACDFPPGPAEMEVGDPWMGRNYMGVVSRYLHGNCGTI